MKLTFYTEVSAENKDNCKKIALRRR